ncbi:hypothetical protein [Hoeflea sp. TYP-13]|uniref:hypothetical protein n=1 Tax=Hoeflea sp. TYP-13 TaxID=3230023 RepID=UPI0034C64654
MLTPEIRRCIEGAALAGVLADTARKRGDLAEAKEQDAAFDAWADRLGDETLGLIRKRKAELAK